MVDDQLAFCGGIDLTGHRWDTSAHRPEEPARTTPLGEAYGPYHEVQAMVRGPAAASLGVLARDRWRALGAGPDAVRRQRPARISGRPTSRPISRTSTSPSPGRCPASESQPAIRECEALFLDSIALAKRTIYIESQYFTNDTLAGALAARLQGAGRPGGHRRLAEGMPRLARKNHDGSVSRRRVPAADRRRRRTSACGSSIRQRRARAMCRRSSTRR